MLTLGRNRKKRGIKGKERIVYFELFRNFDHALDDRRAGRNIVFIRERLDRANFISTGVGIGMPSHRSKLPPINNYKYFRTAFLHFRAKGYRAADINYVVKGFLCLLPRSRHSSRRFDERHLAPPFPTFITTIGRFTFRKISDPESPTDCSRTTLERRYILLQLPRATFPGNNGRLKSDLWERIRENGRKTRAA